MRESACASGGPLEWWWIGYDGRAKVLAIAVCRILLPASYGLKIVYELVVGISEIGGACGALDAC